VFSAAAFASPGAPVAAALVARSVALVQAVAASSRPALVAFVSSPCPAGLVPSPSPSVCFCGLGSGSWASLALAAGLGVPVFVFWCAPGQPSLPAWGSWSLLPSGVLSGAWALRPPAVQLSFF